MSGRSPPHLQRLTNGRPMAGPWSPPSSAQVRQGGGGWCAACLVRCGADRRADLAVAAANGPTQVRAAHGAVTGDDSFALPGAESSGTSPRRGWNRQPRCRRCGHTRAESHRIANCVHNRGGPVMIHRARSSARHRFRAPSPARRQQSSTTLAGRNKNLFGAPRVAVRVVWPMQARMLAVLRRDIERAAQAQTQTVPPERPPSPDSGEAHQVAPEPGSRPPAP
jgi:hypothetical protein